MKGEVSNAGQDRPPSFQSVHGEGWESGINASGIVRVIHELTVEVQSGSTRMNVLIESMTALEYAEMRMVDRNDNIVKTTQEFKEQMDTWNEHQDGGNDNIDEMYETLYSNENGISPYQKSWVMP